MSVSVIASKFATSCQTIRDEIARSNTPSPDRAVPVLWGGGDLPADGIDASVNLPTSFSKYPSASEGKPHGS
jgi:hypothetical protein